MYSLIKIYPYIILDVNLFITKLLRHSLYKLSYNDSTFFFNKKRLRETNKNSRNEQRKTLRISKTSL